MAPRILRREKMLEKIFKLKENNTTARTESEHSPAGYLCGGAKRKRNKPAIVRLCYRERRDRCAFMHW